MAKFLRTAVLLLSLALLAAAMPATAHGANGAYDTDGDGLIEISYLEQLDAVRSDLNGDGTPGDPPNGKGADTASWFAAFPNVQGESACPNPCTGYELTRDLDFNDPGSYASGRVNPEWTSGGGWEPMVFGATFEGNGHTISNLYSNRPFHRTSISTYRKKGGGLFEQLWGASTQRHDVDGIIANLGLVNVNITGENLAYALVGSNNGIIRNSYATGRVSARGLVGGNYRDGRIIDSYADVYVETFGDSTGSAGGLVADNRGLIRGSHARGHVRSPIMNVGGLVGTNGLTRLGSPNDRDRPVVLGTIESSYATGSVTGLSISGDTGGAGGLVGDNDGIINRSYATGPVVAVKEYSVGGLAGTNAGQITASYASGTMWGVDSVGGLVGNNGGVVAGSYATGSIYGTVAVGGLVGLLNGGSIIASYAAGPVTGIWATRLGPTAVEGLGGLVGYRASGNPVLASYAVGPVASPGIPVGGLIGYAVSGSDSSLRHSYWDVGASSFGFAITAIDLLGKTTADLQSPVAYEGIYSNWRVDVDNADGDDDPATGVDDVWDFGDGSQYPALKADLDGDGRATWQEFGDQPRDGPVADTTSPFFWHEVWPEPTHPNVTSPAPNGKYDQDGDGLIEVNYLEQLDAIRHDLEGNGVPNYTANTREGIDPSNNWEEITAPHIDGQAYADAFPTTGGESVCRQRCHGYELARSLDFNDPGSYASGTVNPAWAGEPGWVALGFDDNIRSKTSKFQAIFEGNGFTINNLYIGGPARTVSDVVSRELNPRRDNYVPKGLFGYAGPLAQIRNLGLVDVQIRVTKIDYSYLGPLASINEGIISGCYATGSLQVMQPKPPLDIVHQNLFFAGGLVGTNEDAGEIRNSYASVAMSTVRSEEGRPSVWMGGLIGSNRGVIMDSHATGDVSSFEGLSGGLGARNAGAVLRSHATGNVTTAIAGGLLGSNPGWIIAGYATGDVSGLYFAGGLAGLIAGVVSASYATGDVSGGNTL